MESLEKKQREENPKKILLNLDCRYLRFVVCCDLKNKISVTNK